MLPAFRQNYIPAAKGPHITLTLSTNGRVILASRYKNESDDYVMIKLTTDSSTPTPKVEFHIGKTGTHRAANSYFCLTLNDTRALSNLLLTAFRTLGVPEDDASTPSADKPPAKRLRRDSEPDDPAPPPIVARIPTSRIDYGNELWLALQPYRSRMSADDASAPPDARIVAAIKDIVPRLTHMWMLTVRVTTCDIAHGRKWNQTQEAGTYGYYPDFESCANAMTRLHAQVLAGKAVAFVQPLSAMLHHSGCSLIDEIAKAPNKYMLSDNGPIGNFFDLSEFASNNNSAN